MNSPLGSPRFQQALISPGISPSFRHSRFRSTPSPHEIKEKLRQSYKEKVSNSRHALFSSLRSYQPQNQYNALSEMLRKMFENEPETGTPDEEYQLYEIIKNELLQDEMNSILEEYENNNFDNLDWATLNGDDEMICPTCQKINLVKQNDCTSCPKCIWSIKSTKSLSKTKSDTYKAIEIHQRTCNGEVQFVTINELEAVHLYMICNACQDMILIL